MQLLPSNWIARILWGVWLAGCVAALAFAYEQRAIHDMPVAFYWFMIFLTFPIGYVLMAVFGLAIYLLVEVLGLDLNLGDKFGGLVIAWALLVVAGHLQWFVWVPALYRVVRRRFTSKTSSERP
jgi:hypothetical protein